MIDFRRSFAIFRKDITWSFQNLKILVIMIMPLLLMVFFNKIDSGGVTLYFSVNFTIAFVGIFMTSLLIIEEKRSGMLLTLLTTPLRSYELLIGKFLFALSLCLFFTIINFSLAHKLNLLINIPILLNLVLFCGTCCFYGYLLGLICENEQELGVIAPIPLLIFASGSIFTKLFKNSLASMMSPDYHFSTILRKFEHLTNRELIFHTSFNSLYFISALIAVTAYTNFYFSNNREKRFSIKMVTLILLALSLFPLSGFIGHHFDSTATLSNSSGENIYQIKSRYWNGQLSYNAQQFDIQATMEGSQLNIYQFNYKDKKITSDISFIIRETKSDEKTPDLRIKKVKDKDKSEIHILNLKMFSHKEHPYRQWSYLTKKSFIQTIESHCQDHLFTFRIEIPFEKKSLDRLKQLKNFQEYFKSFNISCKPKDNQ